MVYKFAREFILLGLFTFLNIFGTYRLYTNKMGSHRAYSVIVKVCADLNSHGEIQRHTYITDA